MSEQIKAEPVDKAQSKVDAQRDRLARMAPDDPKRGDEERILDILVKNAQLATTAHLLLGDEIDPAP